MLKKKGPLLCKAQWELWRTQMTGKVAVVATDFGK